jgi:hypothetical protein
MQSAIQFTKQMLTLLKEQGVPYKAKDRGGRILIMMKQVEIEIDTNYEEVELRIFHPQKDRPSYIYYAAGTQNKYEAMLHEMLTMMKKIISGEIVFVIKKATGPVKKTLKIKDTVLIALRVPQGLKALDPAEKTFLAKIKNPILSVIEL